MLTNFIIVNILQLHVYQIIALCILNLHNVICQTYTMLCLSKWSEKWNIACHIINKGCHSHQQCR